MTLLNISRGLLLAALAIAPLTMAKADVVSPLNCTIVGGQTTCGTTSPYGTLTFSQVGTNSIDIKVSVTVPGTVQNLFLNLTDTLIPNTFTATIGSSGNLGVTTGSDNQFTNGSGMPSQGFDLSLPTNPPPTLTGYGSSFTILLTDVSGPLSVSDVYGQLNGAGLDAALHLQNCSGIGACTDSIVVGESTTVITTQNVQEPTSILLLGAGLIGIALMRRQIAK